MGCGAPVRGGDCPARPSPPPGGGCGRRPATGGGVGAARRRARGQRGRPGPPSGAHAGSRAMATGRRPRCTKKESLPRVPPRGGAPGPRRLAVRPPRWSWAGRRRPPQRPAGPSVPPLGAFGRGGLATERLKGVPGGPARPEERVAGGTVPSPRMEGGSRQRPGAAAGCLPGARSRRSGGAGGFPSPPGPGIATPPPPQVAGGGRGKPGAAPCPPGPGAAGPLLSGVGGTSSVESETRRP